MRISLFLIDGFWDTGFFITLDALKLANRLSGQLTPQKSAFEISVIGVKSKIRSNQGYVIPVQAINTDARTDWVILPAPVPQSSTNALPELGRRDIKVAQKHLRQWHADGVNIAASCLGTFLLADAGILDGLEATTTWWLAPQFRQLFPRVILDESRMLVASKNVVTTGTGMGHLDLALWLINKVNPDLAQMVSKYLLADLRSSQARYIIPAHLAQSDPLMKQFEKWSREHLKEGFSLQDCAKDLGVSTRTLQRRCENHLGKSPLAFFQDIRVDHAQSLLYGSDCDLEDVAAEVGYTDGATLRTLLRQKLGRGIRDLRTTAR